MAHSVSIDEAAGHLGDFVARVRRNGESFVLMDGNVAVAELRPVANGRNLSELPGMLAALPRLTPEEAEAFAADIEAGRKWMDETEVRSPWES